MAPPRPPAAVVRVTKQLNAQHAHTGDVRGARALIESALLSRGLKPTLVTANVLIKTYRTASQPEGAEAVLRELDGWGLRPDGCTFSTLVDSYGLCGRVDDARRVAALAEAEGVADSRVYSALLRFVRPEEVTPLMERMIARGIRYDQALCNAALNTFATAGRAAEAEAFVARHMSPSSSAGVLSTGGASANGPSAHARVDSFSVPCADGRTYALLLKARCAAGDVRGACEQLESFYATGERVEAVSVTTVMNALVSASPPSLEAARAVLDSAIARGVDVDVIAYNALLKGHACASPPRALAAEALLDEMCARGLLPSVTSIASVMDAYCALNQEPDAQRLAEAWMSRGMQMTQPVYNMLIKAVSRCRCKRASGSCHCEICQCCRPER